MKRENRAERVRNIKHDETEAWREVSELYVTAEGPVTVPPTDPGQGNIPLSEWLV